MLTAWARQLQICILATILGSTVSVMLRKEIRNMTRQEWDDYMDAILIYKYEGRKDGRDYMINYDHLVAQHAIASMNETYDQAHGAAAFIVWHSMFVREFEIALQSINPTVTVPYWDWTIDAPDADPAKSVLFTDNYFGTSMGEEDLYVVNSSKLAYYPVNNDPLNISGVWWESPYGYLRGVQNYNPSPYITRYVGSGGQSLPDSYEFNQCLYNTGNYSYFYSCEWGSDTSQSNIHAGVHMWAGGTWADGDETLQGDVLDFNTSPNDPLWFSHHAQLDRMFHYWMLQTGNALATDEDPCGGYYGEMTPSPQPPGHNLWDTFVPPFYAYRTIEEMTTLGGLNVSEACYWLNPSRCNYTYPEYTNDKYDDYYGYYLDDDGNRMPTERPTHAPTTEGEASPTAAPSVSQAPTKSAKPSVEPTVHAPPVPTVLPTTSQGAPLRVRPTTPTASPSIHTHPTVDDDDDGADDDDGNVHRHDPTVQDDVGHGVDDDVNHGRVPVGQDDFATNDDNKISRHVTKGNGGQSRSSSAGIATSTDTDKAAERSISSVLSSAVYVGLAAMVGTVFVAATYHYSISTVTPRYQQVV